MGSCFPCLQFVAWRKKKSELLWNMNQTKASRHIYQARTDLESVSED